MKRKEIQGTMEQLHHDLEKMQAVDEEDRKFLQELLGDIQRLLSKEEGYGAGQHQTLIELLSRAITYFDKTHPKLAISMRQIIETLSNMGI